MPRAKQEALRTGRGLKAWLVAPKNWLEVKQAPEFG